MYRHPATTVFGILALLLVLVAPARAQWTDQGVPVVTNDYSPHWVRTAPDGSGGFFVCWQEYHTGTSSDIFIQHVDKNGYVLWTEGVVPICTAPGNQYSPMVVSDGTGGAIIAWQDKRDDISFDIYAQRIGSAGNVLWAENGVAICQAPDSQSNSRVLASAGGGAIIVWEDYRNGSDTDIYTQYVNSTGNTVWATNGVAVCTASEDQEYHRVATDGAGGIIITWQDFRNGLDQDIYAQRVDRFGTIRWAADGTAICTQGENQEYPHVVTDDTGGAIITWSDQRGTDRDIYAQRIDDSGNKLWGSTDDPVCTATNSQYSPLLLADGRNGTFLAWGDFRNGTKDVYAQHLSSSGTIRWAADGVAVCTAVDYQTPCGLVTDGEDGIIIVWADDRDSYANTGVYTQRIDSSGITRWDSNGLAISNVEGMQEAIGAVSDGDGGVIGIWYDSRSSLPYPSIFAQRIGPDGYWGVIRPGIADIRDVPGDQGGQVNVAWDASRLDYGPEHSITRYTLWRAISTGNVPGLYEAKGGAPGIDFSPPGLRAEYTGTSIWYWEQVASVDAYQLETYAKAVPTLFDSTSVSSEYNYYEVIAHTGNPDVFWISKVDSCRSVDNLAPLAPGGLAGQVTTTPFGLALDWHANGEADLAAYSVYRGTSEDFIPDGGNLLGTTSQTTFFDGGWSASGRYYYKVSARDIHENESDFAVLAPDQPSAVEGLPHSQRNVLCRNVPNPFNPSTRLVFETAGEGRVALRVFDTAGRLVRTLANETMAAGRHEVSWSGRDDQGRVVPSGAYFVQLRTADFTQSRKVLLSK